MNAGVVYLTLYRVNLSLNIMHSFMDTFFSFSESYIDEYDGKYTANRLKFIRSRP